MMAAESYRCRITFGATSWSLAAKGKCAIPLMRERHNTNVMFRGGLIRSSDEGSVMGLERRD